MNSVGLHFLTVFIAGGLLLDDCQGATVQFFTEQNFQGKMFQTTSSSNCQKIPSGVTFGWSVRSTGCIVVFYNNGCSPYNHPMEDFVNKLETRILVSLRKSYRDCTDLERGPQVNLDYYADIERKGQRIEFRDICTCTNLPSFNFTSQSLNTFGNHFNFYNESNCRGNTFKISDSQRYTFKTVSLQRSVIPTEIPSHCLLKSELTVEILKFEVVSTSQSLKYLGSSFPTLKFVNNSTKPLERNYDMTNISETAEMQFSEALLQINHIWMGNTTDFPITANSTLPFIKSLKDKLKSSLASTFQSRTQLSLSNPAKITSENKRFEKKVIVPPCTTYELTPFGEIIENAEIDYHIHLSITGLRGSVKVRSEDIRKNLTGLANLNNINDYTLFAESTAKLTLKNVGDLQFNVTATPIPECWSRFLTLTAHIFNIEPITNISNFPDFVHQVQATHEEVFINNGTTPQEYTFETSKQILETGQFDFPKELNRINSVWIEENLESSIQFLTTAWGNLKNEISDIFQNQQHVKDPVKYVTRNNKTFQFQKKINVQPCQKYQLNSFVKISKDVEMEYRVQLRVTGKLGEEVVGVDEIRDNLKGLIFLGNENNQTALAETTIKLTSTFGLSSGVEAVGNLMPECRSRFITLSAKIVDLERVSPTMNETTMSKRIPIATKQIYINNGTTHQEKIYEASKEIRETAEFLLPKDFATISYMRVDEDVKNELEKSIPFLDSVWTKLANGFSPNQLKLNETISFRVGNNKEFRVQETVAVAPCTSYEVDSFIQMTENLEVGYRALLEITGKLGAERVLAEEIRGNLKDVTFLPGKDDFTVVAETIMKLKLSYVSRSGVNAEGEQLLDCLAIQAEIVGNCKFVCSG